MSKADTTACLEDLEKRIDPEVEERLQADWQAFTEGRFHGDIFSPGRVKSRPPQVVWPEVSVNRAQIDLDAMVLQQYGACSNQLDNGAGSMMTVRANYGTAIMPSLFGAELFVMDEKLNTLQTSEPLGAAAMPALIERGIPNLQAGLGAAVMKAGKRFAEIAAICPACMQST